MKNLIAVLLTILSFSCQSTTPTDKKSRDLFPIIENGLWGYINKSGQVIIKPQFRSAGQYSEGLAPVRLNGTYGYIDETGKFIIQPIYDVAYSFEQGQAKVYIDAKPYFIDKKGQRTFDHDLKEIADFGENDFSIVTTKNEKYGIINRKGKLVVDTIYKNIYPFSNGLAIAIGQNHVPNPDKEGVAPTYEIGVINSKGSFIIPFGKYKNITEYINGFAKVELLVERKKGWTDYQGVIDTTGKLRFIIPANKWHFDYENENFSEGLATIDIFSVDPDTVKIWSSTNRYRFKGLINSNGEIVASNSKWDKITPFKNNRAFVQDTLKNWYLIDKQGRIINQEPYKHIIDEISTGNPEYLFQNGIEFVKTETGWGAIDTNGKFVLEPKVLDFDYRSLNRRGAIIFFSKDISTERSNYSYHYGFWNTHTTEIVNAQFHDINFSEFTEDLIYVVQDDRMGYINHEGKYIWREEKKQEQKHRALNIDFMNRGYFYASSPYKKELDGAGGWGGSSNGFKKILHSEDFLKNTLSILVRTNDTATYKQTYEGIKLYLANTSKKTFYFDAQDSRLYLKIQAQDKYGNWKDVEHTPGSWCGNSYHSLFLPKNNYWEFIIPVYEGEFKTRLRAKLYYKKNKDQKEDDILYSNEFNGSINPGQFWRKQAYYPSGLMDPYND
jgi:hypothetical protein